MRQANIKKITPAKYIEQLVRNSVFAKYYKIIEITDGLSPEYVNVALAQDHVDYYSLMKLQEECPALAVKTIKISLKHQGKLTVSIALKAAPEPEPAEK